MSIMERDSKLYLLARGSNTIAFTHRLSTGTAVEISGVWKACPPGKEQTHELQTTDVTVVGAADPEVRVGDSLRARIGRSDCRIVFTDISDSKEIP